MSMSFTINPTQIKRREYIGLAGLSVGLITAVAGIVSLLFLLPLDLSLIAVGSAAFAGGVLVLMHIPGLIERSEKLWG
jgi:hypothetical protein